MKIYKTLIFGGILIFIVQFLSLPGIFKMSVNIAFAILTIFIGTILIIRHKSGKEDDSLPEHEKIYHESEPESKISNNDESENDIDGESEDKVNKPENSKEDQVA